MIIHALLTGTPFVYEIFRIGYCIRSKCKSDKYFIFKCSTVCKACIIIWQGEPRQLYLPSIPYFLVHYALCSNKRLKLNIKGLHCKFKDLKINVCSKFLSQNFKENTEKTHYFFQLTKNFGDFEPISKMWFPSAYFKGIYLFLQLVEG